MKNVIKLIAFITYTISLFWIDNYVVLFLLLVLQVALMLLTHVSIKQAIKNIIYLMPFIAFTIIINLLVMEKQTAILIGVRLIIVCNITYIYGTKVTASEISKAIEALLYPLNKLRVNTRNIGIIISIAITLIPIISKEIENIKYSLLAKGFKMSFLNKIKHINYIMVPLFYGLLKKVGNMEEALLSKGYIAEQKYL